MKVTLESTPTFTTLQGRMVRVWEGRTAMGVPFMFFASHVTVLPEHAGEFELELHERKLHHHGELPAPVPLEDVLRDFGRRHSTPKSIDPRHVL